MQAYSNALKEADQRAYDFYGAANEQVKRHFEINHRLSTVSLVVLIILLITSIGFAIFSKGQNQFFENMGIAGGICTVILLAIMLIRNPLQQAHRLLERNLRVNVAFLSFIRRLQQSDLALRYVFMQTKEQDFAKVLSQIQEFQNILDEFVEQMNSTMEDLG